MLKERREWINKYKEDHAGKIPEDLTDFKNRFDVETPLSPDEEGGAVGKKGEDKEDKAGKKKEKKKEGAKKKGGKGKKGGDDEGGSSVALLYVSEVV